MITQRDKEIIYFINKFGKTYYKVLGDTFFNNEQVARNRINLLIKGKILRNVKLEQEEINAPKTCITLGVEGKKIISDLGLPIKDFRTTTRINHNVYEQIAYYYLSKVATIERTTIASHFIKYKHIPDFILNTNDLTIFVEIELSLKSPKRYIDLITKTLNSGIDRILYIVPDEQMALKIKDYLPNSLSDFISFSYITFEDLKKNVLADGKIKPKSYPKTKDYKKTIQTIEKEKQTVIEPIMNDTEIKETISTVENIETQSIENKIPTVKKSNFNLASFLSANTPFIMIFLFLILISVMYLNLK